MTLWVPNDLLPDALVDAGLEVYEQELESHDRAMFRAGLAWAKEEALAGAQRRDTLVPQDLYWATKNRPKGWCELCGDRVALGKRLEVEHMISKLEGWRLRIPWSILHPAANLAAACTRCNSRKGTRSLGPDDIRWMWQYHHFGGPSEEGHVLLFFSNLLERYAWDVIPLRARVAQDMGRTVKPMPTIGEILRQQGLDAGRVFDRRDRTRREVERVKEKVWKGESASDDNRELWYRAPWQ